MAEQLVCKDSRLWEAVDCFADFEVDESVLCMFGEIVLINCCLRENTEWHFHVLKSVHWCAQVEVLDVQAEISGANCADDAVPHHFRSCEICCARCKLSRVFDEVSSCRESYAIGVCFLRPVVDNDAGVSDRAIVGYVKYFCVGHDED